MSSFAAPASFSPFCVSPPLPPHFSFSKPYETRLRGTRRNVESLVFTTADRHFSFPSNPLFSSAMRSLSIPPLHLFHPRSPTISSPRKLLLPISPTSFYTNLSSPLLSSLLFSSLLFSFLLFLPHYLLQEEGKLLLLPPLELHLVVLV